MQPEVSVIMPAYNQAEWLPEAIESLLAQTFTNWECIIVSDGSTDNVKDVAAGYTKQDNRISFFDTVNEGVSAARNFGISKAKASYILPLDADDKISNDYINTCYSRIILSEEFKVVYGASEKFGTVNGKWDLPKFDFEKLLFSNIIHPCGMFRKKDWEFIGGYDEKMLDGIEDWEFWINILKDGGKAVKEDAAVFYWRRKEESRTTRITGDKNKKLQRYIYCKHATLYEQYFSDPLALYAAYKNIDENFKWVQKNPFRFFISRVKKRLQ